MRHLLLLLLVLLPLAAQAQSPADVAYCRRLADLYDRYIGQAEFGSPRNGRPGGLDNQVAAAQCRQGNVAGIPVLERALNSNGFTLPPRG